MSPREIIQAALRFERPERLPVKMGCFRCDDTTAAPRALQPTEVNGVAADEWGCIWEQTEAHNMGQVKGHPLGSVDEYEKVLAPDYARDEIFVDTEAALQKAEAEDKYVCAHIFMILFERMHSLAGFENVLMGLIADPENTGALADVIVDTHITLVRQYQERFGSRIHGFAMTEDWGTQNAAFIGVDLWNEFFFPRYKRLFDAMHEGGQDVWVHSCGKVNELVDGFIRAGVNSMNLQQPHALGIEEMGERYRGRITFESLADIQATLPSSDPVLIEADAQALAEHWMTPEGGFIFSDYGDGEAIGASPEAKLMMYKAFSRVSEDVYGKPLPIPSI